MFRVYVGGALISILLKSTWTGHLAGENLTYDLFVESPSLLYTSVGKTAQESLFCHLSKTSNCIFYKNIKDTFLTFFLIMFHDNYVTKCTCTFKSVKLNVSSPLCHNIVSAVFPLNSLFFLFWSPSLDYKGLSYYFWVFALCVVTPSSCVTVHHARFVLGNASHWLTLIDIWKQEDTWQPLQCYNNLAFVNKKVMFLSGEPCQRCSALLPPIGCPLLFLSSLIYFLLSSFSSTTSPPADLESSVSLGRKIKDSVGSKSNLNNDAS